MSGPCHAEENYPPGKDIGIGLPKFKGAWCAPAGNSIWSSSFYAITWLVELPLFKYLKDVTINFCNSIFNVYLFALVSN
jgi:hypothetical protein